MKKVFLNVLMASSLVLGVTSCSKEEEKNPAEDTTITDNTSNGNGDDTNNDESPKTAKGTISFTFDGADMSYSNLIVTKNVNSEDSYVVSATKVSGTTVQGVNLVIKKDKTGSGVLEMLNFRAGNGTPSDSYSSLEGNITSDVTKNSNTEVKATFNATLKSGGETPTTVELTNGVIDIKFE